MSTKRRSLKSRTTWGLPGRAPALERRGVRMLAMVAASAVLAGAALVVTPPAPPAQADPADSGSGVKRPAPILTGPGAPARLATTPGRTVGHRDSFAPGPGSVTPAVKPTVVAREVSLTMDGPAMKAGGVVLALRTGKRLGSGTLAASVRPLGGGGLQVGLSPTATGASARTTARAAELVVDGGSLPSSGDALARLVAVRTTGSGSSAKVTRVPVTVEANGAAVRVPVDTTQASTTALTTAASGSTGDYSATELASASTWSVGEQTGAFTWSQPVKVSASSGGLDPSLSIGYASTAVDGRVASTNNQPSWVGEGFSLDPGHIDRSFASCAEDMTGGTNASRKTGDLCWKNDNASITLNGSASRLIKTATPGEWRLEDDDNSLVEHLTGASNGDSGTDGRDGVGEYWRVTTTDGTQYYFGKGAVGSGGAVLTNSTWTVPVNGNHGGVDYTDEPCYSSSFASGFCNQAWRWNLDYVVDVHGNSMTYTYKKETNRYGQNLDDKSVQYDRGGHLKQIDYGQRSGSETTSNASARVLFDVEERCLPSGTLSACVGDEDPTKDTLTKETQAWWPDVPFDLICRSTTSCADQKSPAFFTRKRLTGITSQVLAGGSLVNVAKTELTHSFPAPGDGMSAALFLDKVQTTGLAAGGSTTLPPVQFGKAQMMNRVDAVGDGSPRMYKFRVASISTETGATVSVSYMDADCVAGSSMPASIALNTRRCFPTYWTPDGAADPEVGWFHTYPVASVTEDPGLMGSVPKMTRYTYGSSGLAWHYDSNAVAKANRRTWSENRGFETVTTTVGDLNESKPLVSMSRYLRGMHGDRTATGGSKSETVSTSTGVSVTDLNQYHGHLLEEITYNGVQSSSAEVTGTVAIPWTSAPRATDSLGSAYLTDVEKTSTRTTITGGAKRTTETSTTFTTDGYPIEIKDSGDIAVVDTDDRCTTITYAPANDTNNLRGLVATSRTVAVKCGATYDARTQTISDTRSYYDGATSPGATPVKGDLTKTDTLVESGTTATTYVPVAQATYDAIGRVRTSTDAMGEVTRTDYTPDDHTPTTTVTVTNPLLQTATTTINPRLGQPVTVSDLNNVAATIAYDDLGRRTKVWTASRLTTAVPNVEFAYSVSKTSPSVVTTKALQSNGTTQTASTALYDALLRPLQTQSPVVFDTTVSLNPPVGRAISDVVYDSRGLAIANRGPWPDTASAPNGTYLVKQDQEIGSVTRTTYDGAGRATKSSLYGLGTLKHETSTVYNGDSTDVLPPAGGNATRTLVDGRGRVTELRTYKGNTITTTAGSWATTRYTVNNKDQQTGITDHDGSSWTFEYDLLGRKTGTRDPDAGRSTATYRLDGKVASTTDAAGQILSHEYDDLGRKTATWNGPATPTTGKKISAWAYDNTTSGANGLGRLHTSTRYTYTGTTPNPYVNTVTGYTNDGNPTGSSLSIPPSETGLAGTYTRTNSYYANGQLALAGMPAAPGFSGGSQRYTYDATGRQMFIDGSASIVSAVTRDEYGAVRHYQQVATDGVGVIVDQTYEPGTHRLSNLRMIRPNQTLPEVNTTFAYNPAGKLTSAADVPDPATAARTDRQCFQYDPLGRLKEAWSNGATACTASPAYVATGAAPYWTTWDQSDDNRRNSERQHTATATNDTVITYTYPAATATAPTPAHAPTSVSRKVGTATAVVHALTYDNAGRTRTGPLDWSASTMTYDAEGHLATVKRGTAATSPTNVYDADGNLLVKAGANGTKTLMLGDTQITYTPSTGAKTSKRLYTFEGQVVAVQVPGAGLTGINFTPPGMQGTTPLQVNASNQAVVKRYYTPFGDDRKTFTGWQGPGGFLAATGATTDTLTNLTHLGARDYDPNLGRFLTPDPILTPGDPTQLPAYQYAGNDPINRSDPSGLKAAMADDTGGSTEQRERNHRNNYRRATDVHSETRIYQRAQWANTVRIQRERHWWNDAGEIALWHVKQHVGFVRGVGEGVWDSATGLAQCAGSPVQCAQGIAHAVSNPGEAWNAITAGVRDDYNNGNYGEAAGRSVEMVAELFFGAKGAGALAKGASAGEKVTTAANTAAKLCSFTGATLVLMADGTKKPIEQVKVGDNVLATDPESGEQAAKAVTAVFVHKDTVSRLEIDRQVLETTEDHPFWSFTDQRFERADRLSAMELVLGGDGRVLTVTMPMVGERVATAYNLEIEGIHTYHVGRSAVLVHNTCGAGILTRAQAEDVARYLGYEKTSTRSAAGPNIFRNKKDPLEFVTYDKTHHRGGNFKGAESGFRNPFSSTRSTARSGTYDVNIVNGDFLGLKWIAK